MPFLTLKKITVDDGDNTWVYDYLSAQNARDKFHLEINLLKQRGVVFDDNSSPNLRQGKYKHNGINVSVKYEDKPFNDDARFYCPELTIITR